MRLKKITQKRIWIVLIVLFGLLNLAAYTGAYAMTHFTLPGGAGIGKPRPAGSLLPSDYGLSYVTHRIPIGTEEQAEERAEEWLEAWLIPAEVSPQISSQGTVLLFHGNGGNKSGQLLASAQTFHQLGYNAWLIDFRGVGGSSGHTTTLGIRESEDVAKSLAYAQATLFHPPFVLYGISMGSVAVLRAVANQAAQADAVIVEQPFATLLNAVRTRVQARGVPTFPLAELIVFWGSLQHGFNGFGHNPVDDASRVSTPTLLLQGEKDPWTTLREINQIFDNLKGYKQLTTFPTAGHNLLISVDKDRWTAAVRQFLQEIQHNTNQAIVKPTYIPQPQGYFAVK